MRVLFVRASDNTRARRLRRIYGERNSPDRQQRGKTGPGRSKRAAPIYGRLERRCDYLPTLQKGAPGLFARSRFIHAARFATVLQSSKGPRILSGLHGQKRAGWPCASSRGPVVLHKQGGNGLDVLLARNGVGTARRVPNQRREIITSSPAAGVAGFYNKSTTQGEMMGIDRKRTRPNSPRKSAKIRVRPWPSFIVRASAAVDMEEVSSSNLL